jgi:hypothetical protein
MAGAAEGVLIDRISLHPPAVRLGENRACAPKLPCSLDF